MDFQVIGKSVLRKGADAKVTGSTKYTCDRVQPKMLHGKLLRSVHARAEILSFDLTAAQNIPGLVAILTAKDLPQPVPCFGPVIADQPLLADNKVKYFGEPVAVVLANDEDAAAKAIAAINVNYRELKAVCTLEDALKPDAPLVNREAMGHDGSICSTNVYGVWNYHWGNLKEGRKNSSHIISNTYSFPMVHHYPLEPYSCIAYPEDESIVIISPIQHPFILRRVIAVSLGLPLSKVRIIAGEIGGGFGGKGYPKIEPLAAYLALKTGRSVKFALSTEEGFLSARRPSARVEISTGFDSSGSIVFQDIHADYLIGAYVDVTPRIIAKASYLACGPYRTPHANITARAVFSNTVPGTAFRGFGMPQLNWPLESQMNEIASITGNDPLEIRMRNLPRIGETLIPGDKPADGDWVAGLRKAAVAIGWGDFCETGRGKGIAIGIKSPIPGSVSNAIVRLHADGSVTVCVGTTEMGQGARTVMAQIASEILNVSIKKITIVMGDTAAVPFDLCTAASRSTVTMGSAVVEACQDILLQLREMAEKLVKPLEGDIVIAGGMVDACGKVMSYAELLKEYIGPTQGDIIGKGTFRGRKMPAHPLGGWADFWEIIFTGVQIRVDQETGQIFIEKIVNVSDIGKAINPLQAKGQEEGGAVIGLGHTLMEQMIYNEDGRLLNGNPLDYCVPSALDVPPEMISLFLENEDGPGPFGSKGIGESATLAVAPAVAAAVSQAVGFTFKELPLTPERIWRTIKKRNGGDRKD